MVRVFYLIKALQITMAAIGIYRLLSVDELCEIRTVESLSACVDAMRFTLPHMNTELNIANVGNAMKMRSRRMGLSNEPIDDTILVVRDASLEEIHENNSRRKMLPADEVTQTPKPSSDSFTNIDTTEANAVYETTMVEESSTENMELLSTTGSPNNTMNSSEVIDSDEPSTTTAAITESTENTTEAAASDESLNVTASKQTRGRLVQVANVAEEPFKKTTEKKGIKLVNRVYNCLPSGGRDVIGIGDVNLSYVGALRLPVICHILSIVVVCLSTMHAFTNYTKPRRCRIFTEDIAQIVLWALSGIALLLIRQDWELTWNSTMPGAFVPEYPLSWTCAELSCYTMVVGFLAEFYFYDYIFHMMYFEESFGSYRVVDRPEYANSIYMSTIETTDMTAL